MIASILLLFPLRLQHGQRMVNTQGLTIHNYENVISDVWKTMYSSKKPITDTHLLSFWYSRITKLFRHFAAYQTCLSALTFTVPTICIFHQWNVDWRHFIKPDINIQQQLSIHTLSCRSFGIRTLHHLRTPDIQWYCLRRHMWSRSRR